MGNYWHLLYTRMTVSQMVGGTQLCLQMGSDLRQITTLKHQVATAVEALGQNHHHSELQGFLQVQLYVCHLSLPHQRTEIHPAQLKLSQYLLPQTRFQ